MSRITTKRAEDPAAPVSAEGALLSDIYGRLVPIHASLDEGNPLDSASQDDVARDLMAILRLIESNQEFRAADEAFRAQRRVIPSPRALAAEERIKLGREARRRASSPS